MANARFSIAPAYYTGSEVTPEVTVTHSGKTLVKDRDFTVTYHNNIEPSSYYNSPWVGIDGIGNYQGYVTKSFTINRADISSCTVTLSNESLTYTGSSLRPNATVKSGDKTLAAGTDFTVSYKDNVKEGTAAVTITGAGNYTGIINTTFTITAAPGKDDSDSGKDNPGKNDSDKGNQNSSMKKAKTLTVKDSATRATLKELVSKKKYYVRIRTYKVVSGKKYYSKWSSKKSVKIR